MTEPAIAVPEFTPVDRPEKAVVIAGREILCRGLNETQYMQMVHEATLFRSDTIPTDRKMKGLDRLFRVMSSLIVDPADREWVEDQVAEGEVDIMALAGILREVYNVQSDAPQKVRRGRPKKYA